MVSGPQQALLSVVALNAVMVGLTITFFWAGVFVARNLGRPASYSLSSLGFARPRGGFLPAAGLGMSVGLVALTASAGLNAVSREVLQSFGYSTESRVQQPFMQSLESWVRESPQAAIPAIVFVVVLLGPAVEELVFRGAIFNGLYRLGRFVSAGSGAKSATGKLPFVLAALASSAFFALLHLEPVLLPALLILAFVLCALFARTGSILPSFVAHATFNSLAVLLIILSGLDVISIPI